ncbi:MAG: flagellar protein FlgN [Betaproteobacteria bacterium]|nr:flagellar protein FlgN [Betaproteobacteria bacterium]
MTPGVASGSSTSRPGGNLNEELAALRGFVAILKQEQEALVAGDLERLMPLVKEKTELAARLGQFAEQRSRMLSAAALPADRAGMEKWLARLAPADAAHAAWKSLLGLTSEAHALNQSNGKLIAMRMQHNQQALNVLLAAADQASLYGPDGQTRPSGGGRLFGAA